MKTPRCKTVTRFALTPLCLLLAGTAAQATDGYFANGYGMTSIGMGGAAVAVALEPFGGAVNPGAMSFLDSQWQVGLSWFSPDRSASRTGSGTPDGTPTGGWGIDGSATSGSTNFFIPEFGVNWRYSPELAFGLTVYGNGGMNTDYPGGQIPAQSACAGFNPNPGPYNLLCGNGNLGVDLMQLMIAPYVSWQFTKGHSIGIAPTLAYQRFEANGLQAFDNPMLSTRPGSVTNNGYSDSWGGGVRIGYMGQFGDMISVGAAYATKMSMSEFDDYAGLFAQAGKFDIPSNFTLGAALRPTAEWLLALDFQRIFYSDSVSVSNPSSRLIGNCGPGGAPHPPHRLPGRQQRRRLRLAGHQRLEVRRAVHAEQPVDAAWRLQLHAEPDPAAGRDLQHPRPGRSEKPVDGRCHLEARCHVGDHWRLHVRAGQLRHRHQSAGGIRRATDHLGNDLDEGNATRHRLQPQVLSPDVRARKGSNAWRRPGRDTSDRAERRADARPPCLGRAAASHGIATGAPRRIRDFTCTQAGCSVYIRTCLYPD